MSSISSYSTTRRNVLRAGAALGAVAALPGGLRLSAAAQATPSTLRPIKDWEQLYVDALEEKRPNYIARSLSGDSYMHYGLSYGIDGATAMAEATGDGRYLDEAIEYIDNVLSTTQVSSSLPDSQYQDSYLAWPSSNVNNLGQEVPLYESVLWRYVAHMLRVIRDTPAWWNDSNLRAKYDEYLQFAETHMFEKWYTRVEWNTGEAFGHGNIYRSVTHVTAHWAFIALTLSHLTTSESRRVTYQQVVRNIDVGPMPNQPSSFRDQLVPHPKNPDAYFFDSRWGSYEPPGSRAHYVNHVLDYIVEARDIGSEWEHSDIEKFIVLFDQIVWPTADEYAEYVDGSGTGNGYVGGWVKLGRYDSDLQARLDGETEKGSHWASQQFGNCGLNAKRLGVRYGYTSEQTVAFADADSDVRNRARQDGWTILDLIRKNAPFVSHGAFVRRVEEVSSAFRSDGLITGRDHGAIVRAAATTRSVPRL